MFRSITTFIFGLSLIASLALARPAAAETTVPAIGFADAVQLSEEIDLETGEGESTWVAFGEGTVIGSHETEGMSRFNLFTGEISGEFCSMSLEDEETTVCGTFEGFFVPLADGSTVLQIMKVTWGDGTGKLAGVSGTAEVISVEDEVTNTFHYDYNGFFRFEDAE